MPKKIKIAVCCAIWVEIAAMLLLGGCTTTTPSKPKAVVPCLKTAAVSQQLEKLPLIEVGQTITVVLPADQIFVAGSANLSSKAKAPLNAVTCLLASHNIVVVKVKGYSNLYSSVVYNRALSQSQAAKISNYLWNHGVDSRLIYAEGLGDAQPLASDQTSSGRALNRRVEIQFREIGN